jgi:hypothetical protein
LNPVEQLTGHPAPFPTRTQILPSQL